MNAPSEIELELMRARDDCRVWRERALCAEEHCERLDREIRLARGDLIAAQCRAIVRKWYRENGR